MQNSTRKRSPSGPPADRTGGQVLQRKCGCGTHTIAGGECDACGKNQPTLQRAARDLELETSNSAGVPPIVNAERAVAPLILIIPPVDDYGPKKYDKEMI